MTESFAVGSYGTDDPVYVPTRTWIEPQNQEEENQPETEKGEDEKKNWPPADDAQRDKG